MNSKYTASHNHLLLLDEIIWKEDKALGSEGSKSMGGTWNMKRRARKEKAEMGGGGIVPPFLTSALDGGEWSASRYDPFTPGERAHDIYRTGGWVGPRPGLDPVKKR
jgi:hypothetical protein